MEWLVENRFPEDPSQKCMWSYLDVHTDTLSKTFTRCWPFSESRGCVEIADQYTYISRDFEIVNAAFSSWQPVAFSSGFTTFCDSDGMWGYASPPLHERVAPKFRYASAVRNGLAVAREAATISIIDFRAEQIATIATKFVSASEYSGGLCRARLGGKYYFMNSCGEAELGPYAAAEDFSEGYAVVQLLDGKNAIIDALGNVFFKTKRSLGMAVHHALINCGEYGCEYYVDVRGKRALDGEFECAHGFVGEYAVVQRDERKGVIKTSGDLVVPCRHEDIQILPNELFAVRDDGWRICNLSGEYVTGRSFVAIEAFEEGPFAVELL